MGFFDWIRTKSSNDDTFQTLTQRTVETEVSFPKSLAQMFAGELAQASPQPALLRAMLGDMFRDVDLSPMDPHSFDEMTAAWDEPAWRRLLLALQIMRATQLSRRLAALVAGGDVTRYVRQSLFGFVEATDLLTMDILADSAVRSEEFARHLLMRLGVAIIDETLDQSIDTLQKLDYANLLDEAERAKSSAKERMEYLRKLQEQQEAQMGRRSKW